MRFAEFAQADADERAEVASESDRPAYHAAESTLIALASRYEPAHDPQDRDAEGNIICAECGDLISPARLAALPHTIRCYACQREEERVEARLQREYGGW
ncbi:TraR/DksA C4-type zinc finger protein [Methylomagnum ishizawai]|uniref:TraR/DksA C4-type zinc finger protein n=1 Tax=Methylomagnum ishizawai TaxID=1760988 RepID=UPI001C32AFCE|nr:TraR/DksA C4-type zinc finger protein [Methylomagnum ishizawai]BBL73657.1 hypothetical protein MishRS11D_07550 [Methylomagnum ishizawai]